jgi:hypothetical protein
MECHSEPFAIVILNEVKNLRHRLRMNSAKSLMSRLGRIRYLTYEENYQGATTYSLLSIFPFFRFSFVTQGLESKEVSMSTEKRVKP